MFIEGTDHLPSVCVWLAGPQRRGAGPAALGVRMAAWNDIERTLNEELRGMWSSQQPARKIAISIKARVDPILKQAAQL